MGHIFRRFDSLRARLNGGTVIAGLASALLFLTPAGAIAAGFAVKEQSTAAQGNSFAGATAGAEDATYMFFNPAGLTRHADHQAALIVNDIIVQGETANADAGVGGEPASGDAAVDAVVPAAYAMWSVSPDLKLGIGINAPFGLKTEYSQTWAGRYHSVESDMKTININPAIAYRINDVFSVGAGLQIQHIDVTLSNMVNFGGPDLLAEVTGDDWGFGATLGLLAELSDDTRLGLGYRSQVKHNIKGDFTIGGGLVSDALADFTAPDMASAGIYHDINSQWAVMGELAWTRWSSFDELRIMSSGGLISQTPEDWEDVWFFALGATWKPNETWSIRAGAGYDQTPIPDNRRTPRITDEDRILLSLGAQFRPSQNVTINAAYSHFFIKDGSINLPAGYTTPGLPALTANYENSVDILSVQAVFHF
ncbi:MAG: outer membrane protein transport protein [Proteobacteria bacterium]|nr:outer membrane protein transport protein [Pseudomonadota bacterium]